MMYDYGHIELSVLSCFWLKPELLEQTKLEEKHFKYGRKIFIVFKSFYKKFGNLDIESICRLVNDQYKFMDYMKVISQQEPTIANFNMYENLMIELYEEADHERWIRETAFRIANDFYIKNIDSKEFKRQIDTLYEQKEEKD